MAYYNKYYIEFQDEDITAPALWRADIMDSVGIAPPQPLKLIMGRVPLLIERLDTDEDKGEKIIGRQVTLSYMYTGAVGEPHPDDFYEADERRYRMEVRKNGVIDGVYYITADFSSNPDSFPPYEVNIKATCGLSYLKGVPFNMYDNDGLILYDKVSLYDAIMTRGLLQILDAGTKLNWLNSLYPTNIEAGVKVLFGVFVHTDIFYDFIKGASSVYDVLFAFALAFKARVFIDNNEVWFVRTQDLTGTSFDIEQYIDSETVNVITIPGFVKSIGPNVPYDGIPVNGPALKSNLPALKKVEYEVKYRSINQLSNFQWEVFDGTDFEDWTRALGTPAIGRAGLGLPNDPYRAVFPYSPDMGAYGYFIAQGFFTGDPKPLADQGDIIQLEMNYRFDNTKSFSVLVVAQSERTGPAFNNYVLSSSGQWIQDIGTINLDQRITLSRSGKKRDGSFRLTSQPLPKSIIGADVFDMPYELAAFIFYPIELSDFVDGPFPPTVQLYPIKLGVVSMSSDGRHITGVNTNNFKRIIDTTPFTFIDTGIPGLSNTLFTGVTKEPVNDWDSAKPGVVPADIERHMVSADIDQYQRSVKSWEGTIHSNTVSFFNPLDYQYQPGFRFVQLKDSYNVRKCEHDMFGARVFEEGTGSMNYSEYDIDDEAKE